MSSEQLPSWPAVDAEDGSLDEQRASWEDQLDRRALDELFALTHRYRSSAAYMELLEFVGRFREYAPFNAMLVRIQLPGSQFVAPPSRWLRDYGRRLKPGARPLVILQPRGPVMFVFDVGDTEPVEGAPPLPREVTHPFDVRAGSLGGELDQTKVNAARDGISIQLGQAAPQGAGSIRKSQFQGSVKFQIRKRPKPEYIQVPVRYEILLNERHSAETRYATLVHELAHLYCGHLGTPDPRWWPDRRFVAPDIAEFEAESVSFLVCQRLGLDSPAEEYLASYVRNYSEPPALSLECVMKVAGLIEKMGHTRMKPRKDRGTGVS